MKRREFIATLGGAAAWPLAARGQGPDRVRSIGVLMTLASNNPDAQSNITTFLQALQQLGWTDGRNLRVELRWSAGDANNVRKHASELAGIGPDVIFAAGGPSMGPLLHATLTVPIVFAAVPDPVGSGFVAAWRARAATLPALCSSNTV